VLLIATIAVSAGKKKRKDRGRKDDKGDKDTDRGEDELPDLKDGRSDGVIFEYGTNEYLSVAHHVSVDEAEEACKKWGGTLASIHSVSENIAIKNHIRSRYAWIGVTDKESEGRYHNMDGSDVNFNSYARGQPNNFKNEDYTILKDNGAWYDSGPPRMDHPFGPQHGYICKRTRVEVEIPDEFSCFENMRFWHIHDCQNSALGTWGSYQTLTSGSERLPELCIAAFNSTLSRGKELPETNSYIFKMTLESLAGFMNSIDRGHVGVAFNIQDENHYDFIYFRVNTPKHCYSTGYKDGATVQVTSTGSCADISVNGQDDVIIHVLVKGHNVQVKADGVQIRSFTSRFSGKNSAAALTRNGKYYKGNTVGFKNTMVCQSVQCKVQVADHTVELEYRETIRTNKCETCRCKKFGQLECKCDEQTDVVCKGGEVATYDKECCKKCVPKPATCLITGDPHYYTFDNIWHHFQGVCKYVLVKTADFEIHSGNEVRYGNPAVTWTKEIMIWFKDSEYSIRKGHLFSIDEIQKVVPYKKVFPDGYTVDVKRIGSQSYFKIRKEGSDLMTVKFDGNHRIEIELEGVYKETTQGLCGTWNDNKQDEYQTREGAITNDLNEFGNSWKEKDEEFCPDPPPPPHVCDDQPELWNIARDVCSKLNETMFSPCHSLIDRTGFYEACLVDVCMCMGDKHCGCAAVASYADQCSERGISVNWRTTDFCPLPCEDGFQFNHCGSECVASCSDPDPDCDRSVCVEGCFCPPGKLFFDNECIDPKDCVCTWEGEIRDIGDVWDNQESCQTCTCVDAGNIVCNDTICEECPEGHVPIVVDEEECCPTCVTDWLIAVDDKTDFKHKVGDSVTFGVEIHLPVEIPAERLKWEKRRQQNFLQTKKYDMSDDRKYLTVSDLTLQDEGIYRLQACIDKDNNVCGAIEFRLSVKNDIILAVDPHQTVTELGTVTFGVIILGVDPAPGYQQLMWLQEDQELLPPSSNRIKAENSRRNLTISNVVKADEGNYKCGLTLEDGSYHWVDFTLTVEEGDSKDILVAVQTPVSVMHSSSATLAVKTSIKNVPPTSFTWIRNDAYIDAANNPKYSFVNYRKGLVVRDVKESDAGIYTAQMMYGKIHVRADVELRINTAEVDIRPENSPLKTVVGQTAHFLVTIDSVQSVPWKSIDWYRISGDGKSREQKITPPSGRFKTPDSRRKLVIQAVQKSDEGYYEVEVKHKGSVVSARVQLQVLENKWVNSQ